MFERLRCFLAARGRFRGYQPQPVTLRTVARWVGQFEKHERGNLPLLLRHVTYITEPQATRTLCELNASLLDRLVALGVPANKVIYVQVDDAGSSSPYMLSVLRNAARLESRGCTLVDSRDTRGLRDATDRLEEGAIVYVDDFAGTGDQFCRSRDFVAQCVVGNFAEFFLALCVCEEAARQLEARGVEPVSARIHRACDRALRPESRLLPDRAREQLSALSARVNGKFGLGYRNLGSMVVLYRNAPNSVPLVIRGSRNQAPYVGILPRTTDLPPLS